MNEAVLVVERDDALRGAIRTSLEASGWRVVAQPEAPRREDPLWDRVRAAVVEIGAPDVLDAVEGWTARDRERVAIGLVPDRNLERAVRAMQRGIREILPKPFSDEALAAALSVVATERHPDRIRCPLLAEDPTMQALLHEAKHAAASEATIHIRGESGTGKDLLTRWIHACSHRRDEAMVVVNCTALPQGLAESELFGHEEGAFTGASRARVGQVRSAHRGTLILDQIEELDLRIQPKLLRVLQEREVISVGGRQPFPVDLRVLATSQRPLEEEVQRGRFREDLFYRLDVIALAIPPLRERPRDIPVLAAHFLERFARAAGVASPRLGAASRRALCAHRFPGNVRELENLMRRAVVWMPGAELDVERLLERRAPPARAPLATLNLKDLERAAVTRALEECDGVRVRAAAALGISERTLRNKIRLYGLR